MALRDSTETFGAGSRAFHWIMALAIIAAWLIGMTMSELESGEPEHPELRRHMVFGTAVLTLAALRLLWRLANPTPAPVPGTPALQQLAARGAHILLYVLMFAMPITGVLMNWAEGRALHFLWLFDVAPPYAKDPELGEMLEETHDWLGWLLILMVAAHVAAALYHHVICRDCTLRRMLTGRTS